MGGIFFGSKDRVESVELVVEVREALLWVAWLEQPCRLNRRLSDAPLRAERSPTSEAGRPFSRSTTAERVRTGVSCTGDGSLARSLAPLSLVESNPAFILHCMPDESSPEILVKIRLG